MHASSMATSDLPASLLPILVTQATLKNLARIFPWQV